MSEIMIIPLEYIERENVYVLCEHDNSSMDRETCAVAQVLRMLMGVHHTILFRERSLLPTLALWHPSTHLSFVTWHLAVDVCHLPLSVSHLSLGSCRLSRGICQ